MSDNNLLQFINNNYWLLCLILGSGMGIGGAFWYLLIRKLAFKNDKEKRR